MTLVNHIDAVGFLLMHIMVPGLVDQPQICLLYECYLCSECIWRVEDDCSQCLEGLNSLDFLARSKIMV